MVVCQHSHCIGCEEKWKTGTIVYGQGNFLFDNSSSEFWMTSILVQVDLSDFSVTFIPIKKEGNSVCLATGEEEQEIISAMCVRSRLIQKNDFVENAYAEFAKSMITGYMMRDRLESKKILFRILDKLTGHRISTSIVHKRLKKYALLYMNQYDCEAHRELILKGLEISIE